MLRSRQPLVQPLPLSLDLFSGRPAKATRGKSETCNVQQSETETPLHAAAMQTLSPCSAAKAVVMKRSVKTRLPFSSTEGFQRQLDTEG